MRYGITGARGLIGAALEEALRNRGHEVAALPRVIENPATLEGLAAVIHLAGAPIGEHRWTEARKALIRESRVEGTRSLVDAISSLENPLPLLISASAIGVYGNRGGELLDESSNAGKGFLADVALEWEAEAARAAESGVRVVLLRTGIVLSTRGGALPRMIQPFRWFTGGPLGEGDQWVSWIHLEDEIRAILFAMETDSLEGPLNLTAPNPVTNLDFARLVGKALGRPAAFRIPAMALRMMLGAEMADSLLLSSQKVMPRKLLQADFEFRFSKLDEALADLLGARI